MVPQAVLAYRVIGDPAVARANGWILLFHALTGHARADEWWGPLIGPGRAFDTSRHAIVIANHLGGCTGSTGPASWTPSERPHFPLLTPADLAAAHLPLLRALGVERLALVVGGSLGGMVALEFGRVSPVPIDHLVVLAAPARASASAIAWNAAQRLALEADPRWLGGAYPDHAPPEAGLAAARAIAMLSYRSAEEFAARFGRQKSHRPGTWDVEQYLRRHGEKLVARFDAATYHGFTRTLDAHDVGDLATAARETAERVQRITGAGVDSDRLYAAGEVRDWVAAYRAAGAPARYAEIASLYGHDAFLIETGQVGALVA